MIPRRLPQESRYQILAWARSAFDLSPAELRILWADYRAYWLAPPPSKRVPRDHERGFRNWIRIAMRMRAERRLEAERERPQQAGAREGQMRPLAEVIRMEERR